MNHQELIDRTNELQEEAFRICEQFQFREITSDDLADATEINTVSVRIDCITDTDLEVVANWLRRFELAMDAPGLLEPIGFYRKEAHDLLSLVLGHAPLADTGLGRVLG